MTAEPCPACGKPVLEIRATGGGTVRLNPAPVRDHGHVEVGGRWYRAHRCAGRAGGLDDVRRAQAEHARSLRTQRPRPAAARRGQFGTASGIRYPPGGAR